MAARRAAEGFMRHGARDCIGKKRERKSRSGFRRGGQEESGRGREGGGGEEREGRRGGGERRGRGGGGAPKPQLMSKCQTAGSA